MAATNYILAIYQALWNLANAHAPTEAALKLGNQVREDGTHINPRGTRAKAPADFPRAWLRHTGVSDTGFTEDPTFAAMESDIVTAGDGWGEKIAVTYELKVIHADLVLTKASIFELELMTAIRKGGPRLGLDYVIGWTTNAQTTETATDPDAPDVIRRVTVITITVNCWFEGSELIV